MRGNLRRRPIGIFDSGVGGLTLFRSIRELLPNESLIYFGDTARLPYGTKSPESVCRFSLQIGRFLQRHNIKALVVACHTASSTSIPELKKALKIPVVGVIEPAVRKAVLTTKNKSIGVIGTKTTILSQTYQSMLKKIDSSVSVKAVPAPLLVPLVEEGWLNREVTRKVLEEYLSEFSDSNIDTLILGCTHYPILMPLFEEVLKGSIYLVEPSIETAFYLKELLLKDSLLNPDAQKQKAEYSFFVTDDPENFSRLSKLFLKEKLQKPHLVCLEELDSDIRL